MKTIIFYFYLESYLSTQCLWSFIHTTINVKRNENVVVVVSLSLSSWCAILDASVVRSGEGVFSNTSLVGILEIKTVIWGSIGILIVVEPVDSICSIHTLINEIRVIIFWKLIFIIVFQSLKRTSSVFCIYVNVLIMKMKMRSDIVIVVVRIFAESANLPLLEGRDGSFKIVVNVLGNSVDYANGEEGKYR